MQRLNRWLDLRTDTRPLALARIIVGIAATLKLLDTTANSIPFFGSFHLRMPYPIPSLLPDVPMTGQVLMILWAVFCSLFLLGYCTTLAGAGLSLTIFAIITFDQQLYSNHLYLLGLVVALLTIAGAGARYSVDARTRSGPRSVPVWAITLLKLQLTSIYLFAALSKLNGSFLAGDVFRRSFDPVFLGRVDRFIGLEILAIVAILTELFLALAFWHHLARWLALPVAITFHSANVLIVQQQNYLTLSAFAIIMLSLMVLFFADVITRRLGEQAEPQPEVEDHVPVKETLPATG